MIKMETYIQFNKFPSTYVEGSLFSEPPLQGAGHYENQLRDIGVIYP